jgi:hypothetical protein
VLFAAAATADHPAERKIVLPAASAASDHSARSERALAISGPSTRCEAAR